MLSTISGISKPGTYYHYTSISQTSSYYHRQEQAQVMLFNLKNIMISLDSTYIWNCEFFTATLQQKEAFNLLKKNQQKKKSVENHDRIYSTSCNFSPMQFLNVTVEKMWSFQLENLNFMVANDISRGMCVPSHQVPSIAFIVLIFIILKQLFREQYCQRPSSLWRGRGGWTSTNSKRAEGDKAQEASTGSSLAKGLRVGFLIVMWGREVSAI